MTKEKLLSVTRRIFKPEFAGLSVEGSYLKFVSEFPFTELSKVINSEDIVMISFLLPHGNNSEVMSNLYDTIKSSLFGFSVMEIDEEEPEEECTDCYGQGSDDCPDCGGSGNEDCSDCDGDGEDEEGETCSTCDGEGKMECSYCDSSGSVPCSTCDGDGHISQYGAYAVSQYFVVSYDKDLLDVLELKEQDDHIEIKLQTDKTLRLLKKDSVINDGNSYEVGELYFIELTESPQLRPSGQGGRVDINNLYDIGN